MVNFDTYDFVLKKLAMWLTIFSVVVVTLTGEMCLSKSVIEINKSDGIAELEEAAIKILTTCLANQDKTIVLVGDFPGNFIERLSSNRSFSLVLLHDKRRALDNTEYSTGINQDTMHKVYIVVMAVSNYERYTDLATTVLSSAYHNEMAFVLILDWSSKNKYGNCGTWVDTIVLLMTANLNNQLNANLICRDSTKGIVIYSSNPFGKMAPEPWRFVRTMDFSEYPRFGYFMRKYREHEGMCKNLYFEKTHDLVSSVIEVTIGCVIPYCSDEGYKTRNTTRKAHIQDMKRLSFIDGFLNYVNATRVNVYDEMTTGVAYQPESYSFQSQPTHLRGVNGSLSYVYPYGVECKFLISQFRGNKSQLEKILSVIDSYSWYGMYITYVITLIFLKYFLRQPLIVAILNLVRLTCNFGFTTLPSNVAPRIYLGCLLFFVVTMQGIFVGNLAALLTQDIPIRQIDSVQDVADLGYTVYSTKEDFINLNHSVSKSRIKFLNPREWCVDYVLDDRLTSCLMWGAEVIDQVALFGLHKSPGCVAVEYLTTTIPWKWVLEERLNKFLGIIIGGGIMMPLDTLVDEQRMLEAEAEEEPIEPRIMTLRDLKFSFVILGIGLAFAIITFIIEIIIHRLYRRVTTTRVIILN